MTTLSPRRIREFQETLQGWFAWAQRPMPWRQNRTIYGTWISEIMLQQTTVAVVEPYWLRFMERFPDVHELARASEPEVLAQWSGLGYYRRARHLHQAAQEIATSGAGFPRTLEGWARLPGIGPYASGAIASQALGLQVPAVDANARRVLTRWLVDDPESLGRLQPADLAKQAQALVPAEDPGNWNQAVMELGALVCQLRKAACSDCPVLHLCRAGLAGTAGEIPAPKSSPKKVPVHLGVLVVRQGRKTFLARPGSGPLLTFPGRPEIVRSDFSGLHQGLWGLPATAWVVPECEINGSHPGLTPELRQCLIKKGEPPLKPDCLQLAEVGKFRHAITRYLLDIRVYLLHLREVSKVEGGARGMVAEPGTDDDSDQQIKLHSPDPKVAGIYTSNPEEHPISNLARKALVMVGDNFG